MIPFIFDEMAFVFGPPDPTLSTIVSTLQMQYPELSHWNPVSFDIAWGDYSADCYATPWVDWLNERRDVGFLAYCYVRQRWPAFDFGGTGLYDDDIQELAAQHPWNCFPLPPAPGWLPAAYKL
ncbi:hypothetical protein HKZ40_003806 [Salmonella enterica]|nr:hypothetical protein [Salmonella enterica]